MKVTDAAFAYGSLMAAVQAVDNASSRISLEKDHDLLFEAKERIKEVSNHMHDWILLHEEKKRR